MNSMKKSIFYTILFLLAFGNCFSQNTEKEIFALHPRIGAIYNLHLPNFNSFEGAADCGLFKKGNGFGYSFSLTGEKLFWKNYFLGIGIGYTSRSGKLVQNLSYPSRNLETGEVVQVNSENQLQANLGFLEFQPEIRGIISREIYSRWVCAGRFYLPIRHSFEQKEKIISPAGATFIAPNDVHTIERALAGGDISSINKFGFGLTAGVEALFPNNKDNITVQLLFDYNPMNFTSDANWKYLGFRAEIGYRISFLQKPKPIEEPKPIEKQILVEKPKPIEMPIPIEPPSPLISFAEPKPEPIIKISDIQVQGKVETGNELLASIPIVNSVFFERNSSKLSQNYDNAPVPTSNFEGNAVEMHYSIFYRIAQIIKNNPDASILLESSTSGPRMEPKGITLSLARANAVKNKLIAMGVPKSKIRTRILTNPSVPSNQEFEAGIEENQRVDIILNNAQLQEYVNIQRYANFIGTAEFKASLYYMEPSIKATISSNLSKDTLMIDKSDTYQLPIFSKITEEQQTLNLELRSFLNNTYDTAFASIKLSEYPKENVELRLDNFLAILRFEYNSSVITDENKELLKQLIQKLPANSTIEILGSADELGTQERNEILSRERAANTRAFIQSIAKDKFNIETGTNQDKFPEDTPQGRFLNRSIRVRVKK